jgi:hypothetical protein
MGLSFTIASGPRQRSHSQVRVPRDSWPHFTVSDSRLPQTGGSRFPYLYPPGTGWPGYTPRHWVLFSSPPTTRRATVEVFDPACTRGNSLILAAWDPCYIAWGRSPQNAPLPLLLRTDSLLQRCVYRTVAWQRARRGPHKTPLLYCYARSVPRECV